MDNPERVQPLVDDKYWFDYSEKHVSTAVERRDKAAAKLQNLVLWLWGIYTTYAAVGFVLSKKPIGLLSTILIAAASAFLIAVYWGTVWVQMPPLVHFDRKSASQIREKHGLIVKTKDIRLKVTLLLSIIAAIMVTVALIVASVSKAGQEGPNGFIAKVYSQENKHFIALTANIGNAEKALVAIKPIPSRQDPSETTTFVFSPTEKGLIQTSIPVSSKVNQFEVRLEWKDKSRMKTMFVRTVTYREVNYSQKKH